MATLLVVEDNQLNQRILRATLEKEGFATVGAASGEDALAALEEHEVDLVLLDVMLPRLSGLGVLERVRRQSSALELPIIMVTARTRSDDVVCALELGANDYVTKPVDFAIMLARIRTHLEMKRLKEAYDDLLRMARHDLKKPLAVMVDIASTLAESARPGVPLGDEWPLYLSHVVASGEYMERLINSSLELDALERGAIKLSRREVDLNELVRRSAAANHDSAKKKEAEVVLELAPELPAVSADPERLGQVLDNLLGNALKFSPPGSRTVLRTSHDGDEVIVEVVDEGPGLKEADFARVFKKHARLSAHPTGGESSSGLGLAICRLLVELHGGSIGVANNAGPGDTAGRGATFSFRLPRQ